LATALASKVLPHPGGPYSKTPAGASIPNYKNFSGLVIGNISEEKSSSLSSLRAPISSQVTSGTTANPSLLAVG
jgi:hypothetical protein